MKVHKSHIIELLRSRGHHDKADEAEAQLPDEVDTEHHSDVLSRWGVDANDVVGGSKLGPGRLGL